jgi:hypothetical protein
MTTETTSDLIFTSQIKPHSVAGSFNFKMYADEDFTQKVKEEVKKIGFEPEDFIVDIEIKVKLTEKA